MEYFIIPLFPNILLRSANARFIFIYLIILKNSTQKFNKMSALEWSA